MNSRFMSLCSESAGAIDSSSMDEAIEVLEGQSGCTDLYALNGILSADQDSFGDDAAMAPKVRKPYTITKQREKWSEEEHKKFLEAVQLHGRAWRRIEEHIGTKTAVQIRSHAQKFVSKMARDANDNGTSNIQPIEIPPPRPKKKPTHPYPRKQVVRPAKEIPVLGKLERPSSPTLSVSEQDRSPTSELSVVRTESIDPFLSKNSPGSNNHRSGIPSPKNLIEGDGKHLSLGLTLARLTTEDGHTTEDEPTTELDMNSSIEHLHSKEASSAEPGTLKLFGRTIMVADSCSKSSSITAADDRSSQNPISESNCNAAMEFDSGRQSAELMNTTWPVSFLPAFYCWPPLHENEANSAGEARVIRLPWLPLYAGMPFPCVVSNDLYQSNLQNDCSGTGSNTDHEGANAVESKPDDGRDEKEAGFSVVRTATKIDGGRAVKCNKGFVPYRRCDLEEKVKRPNMAGELVGDGQTVKLCS